MTSEQILILQKKYETLFNVKFSSVGLVWGGRDMKVRGMLSLVVNFLGTDEKVVRKIYNVDEISKNKKWIYYQIKF